MWKKRFFYGIIVLGLMRLAVSLYSMIPPVFSQGSAPKNYFISDEHYKKAFKKALDRDIDNIVDTKGSGNVSELDVYIGELLLEKEQQYPGFERRNQKTVEALRSAVKNYAKSYTTFWNESKWDDFGDKPSKRQIHAAMCGMGNNSIKPLLDTLVHSKE